MLSVFPWVLGKPYLLGHLPSVDGRIAELLLERLVNGGTDVYMFCSVPGGTIEKVS